MRALGKSVIGMCRTNNEDAIYFPGTKTPEYNVYIVADGMGGCNAGEVASSTAVKSFLEFLAQKRKDGTQVKTEILDSLVEGVTYVNRKVFEKSYESPDYSQMGTTFIVATIDERNKLYIVYVGDSRVYLQHQDEPLTQLTTDHSYVMELVRTGNISMEEAAVHPKRNLITRAVGIRETVEPDSVIVEVEKGDLILLCSDGLSNMLTNFEIESVLKENIDLQQKVDKMINLANKKGGFDNISLVLIER